MTLRRLVLKVLFISQGGMVVALALEKDIAAQGQSHAEAKHAFEQTLLGQVILDRQLGREPLSTIAPAPARYFDAFAHVPQH